MATVRMKKGDKFADIYDSPETIKQAQLDGFSLVEKKAEPKDQVVKAEEPEKEADAEETKASAKKTKRQ